MTETSSLTAKELASVISSVERIQQTMELTSSFTQVLSGLESKSLSSLGSLLSRCVYCTTLRDLRRTRCASCGAPY